MKLLSDLLTANIPQYEVKIPSTGKKTKFRLDMSFLSCNPNITSVEKLKSQIIFNGKNQYKVTELFFVSGFDVKNIFKYNKNNINL